LHQTNVTINKILRTVEIDLFFFRSFLSYVVGRRLIHILPFAHTHYFSVLLFTNILMLNVFHFFVTFMTKITGVSPFSVMPCLYIELTVQK